MMKLGLVSSHPSRPDLEEVIDYAARTGFSCVEVCCWPKGKALRRYAGVTHIDLNGLTDEKMKYYVDYAASKGVEISSLAYYPNPLDGDEEAAKVAVDHIMALIEVSAKMASTWSPPSSARTRPSPWRRTWRSTSGSGRR